MDIPRSAFEHIAARIGSQKVILLYGTRRTGKTTLARAIGRAYGETVMWLNGEDFDTHTLLANRTVANYRALVGTKKLLIIDEAQAIPEIGAVLKLMIDEVPNITVVATGSSSFDLTNRVGEPLVGRSHTFKLYPISQHELSARETLLETRASLPQRLVYGSYPELWQMQSDTEKEAYLKSIVSSYLLKDILSYADVKGADVLYKLLQLLAWQTGSLVSTTELGNTLKIKSETVDRYLDLLSKVFIVFPLGGYSNNLRKEVSKSRKWYFYDNGVRNALINDFRPINSRNDLGQLWEQYLISERIKLNEALQRAPRQYYWRTYDQQEIDLLEIDSQQRIRGFECKWKPTKVRVPLAFAKAYPEASFEVVSPENYLQFITAPPTDKSHL